MKPKVGQIWIDKETNAEYLVWNITGKIVSARGKVGTYKYLLDYFISNFKLKTML